MPTTAKAPAQATLFQVCNCDDLSRRLNCPIHDPAPIRQRHVATRFLLAI